MAGKDFTYDDYLSEAPQHTHEYLWPIVVPLLAKDDRILDAGCGNGAFVGHLHTTGYNACGIDLSESGIAQAKHAYPDVDFRVLSVTDDLSHHFGTLFDTVVSLEVVEHLYDPNAYAKAIYNVLRPGGLFVVTTPFHGYLKNCVLSLTGRMDAHFTALWPGGHIKFWSRKTLTLLLEKAGFHVTEFHGAGRFPYLWKSMVLIAQKPSN